MLYQFLSISVLSFISYSQLFKAFKLNYRPSGKIIQFNMKDNLITTDQKSIYELLATYDDQEYAFRIKNLLKLKFANSNVDTIKFVDSFIPLGKELGDKKEKKWYVKHVVLELIKRNQVQIKDKTGQMVRAIKTRKLFDGKKKGAYRKFRVYYNKENDVEILREYIKGRTITPKF